MFPQYSFGWVVMIGNAMRRWCSGERPLVGNGDKRPHKVIKRGAEVVHVVTDDESPDVVFMLDLGVHPMQTHRPLRLVGVRVREDRVGAGLDPLLPFDLELAQMAFGATNLCARA